MNCKILNQIHCLHPNNFNEYPSIIPLCKEFPNIVKKNEFEEIDEEYRMAMINLKNENIDAFWADVFQVKNSSGDFLYPMLIKFVKAMLSLPRSSAVAERVFSQLSYIKN